MSSAFESSTLVKTPFNIIEDPNRTLYTFIDQTFKTTLLYEKNTLQTPLLE